MCKAYRITIDNDSELSTDNCVINTTVMTDKEMVFQRKKNPEIYTYLYKKQEGGASIKCTGTLFLSKKLSQFL